MLYLGVKTAERLARAKDALEIVGLGDRMDSLPNQLSGGQQQRVAIARSLVNQPSIILADEPTGNLDSRTAVDVMSVFQKLNEERGITIAVVTHEHDIAQYARRVVVFRDGRIKSDEMITNPRSAKEELESMPELELEEDDDE
jgi:putative ABC transport system ATP-binding protein